MKTAISIPDDVFASAERLTHRLRKSRIQLYTEAVREYLARHDPDAITEALNRISDLFDPHLDPAIAAASTHTLQHMEW